MNFFREIFKNSPNIFYNFFSAEGQTERGTNIMNRISHFWCAITNVLHMYRRHPKISGLLTDSAAVDIILLGVTSTWIHTGSIGRYECLRTENPIFNITLKFNHSVSNCGTEYLFFLLRHYYFIPDTNNYKVIIPESSNEICKHKKNPVIVFMCKIAVKMKLYRAKKKRLSLLNVRTTAQEYTDTNIRLLKER